MAKVSVIVPIYNIEEYLKICIESIINQSYKDLEIILVDDGATDNSRKIVDEFATTDNRIVTIHKKNGGLVSARKAGISIAEGEYVLCVDGDDAITQDCVEQLVKVAEDEDADAVIGICTRKGEKKLIESTIPTGVYKSNIQRKYFYSNMLSGNDFFSFGVMPFVCGKLFKTNVFRPYQMMVDERISVGEDVACTYPALLNMNCIAVTPFCGYIYTDREESMSSHKLDKPDESLEHLIFRYSFMKSYYERINDYKYEMLKQLNEYIYFTAISKYPEMLFSDDGKVFLPFSLNKSEKAVIYGAGAFGNKIADLLKKNGFQNIVCQIDKNAYPSNYARSVASLLEMDYDKVLLASIRREIQQDMYLCIKGMGVPEHKIMMIRHDKEICEYAGRKLEERRGEK